MLSIILAVSARVKRLNLQEGLPFFKAVEDKDDRWFDRRLPRTPAEHVRRLHAMQRRLSALGFYDGRLDAKHGPKTERAVRDFQAAAGLKVDGIAGPQTVERMKASFKDAGLHKDGSAPSQSVFTSRAAADAVVVSWAFEDVIGLCADHPDLKQELRRAFSHSAVSKALGLARNHGVG